jgi:heat shock transcription factor
MPATRKRPAPGTSPLPPREQTAKDNRIASPDMAQPNFPGWQYPNMNSPSDQNAVNFSSYQSNGQQISPTNQYIPSAAQQLTRRQLNGNQNMVQAQYGSPSNGQWADNGAQPPGSDWPVQYDDLDQRAEVAKGEATAKRKTIPPFIQKLSRYG